MPLFEFELLPVEDIRPWGDPGQEELSWFVLTDGVFRIRVGDQVLFRYSDEILSHWGVTARDASYYLASLARDVLGSVAPGVAPLPETFERLTSDWELVARLRAQSGDETEEDEERYYTAWRWLGARSPWASYFQAHPDFHFVRIGGEVHVHWDNRDRVMEGLPVWSAQEGVHVLPVETFLAECRDFAGRLLLQMKERIDGMEAGTLKPQVPIDAARLRNQHEIWRTEFDSYFRPEAEPELPWAEVEEALRALAARKGVAL